VGKVSDLLFAPLAKAIALAAFTMLGNVLTGAYVFEITKSTANEQYLDWWSSPNTRSFWGIIVILTLMVAYGWRMARFDTKISTQSDIRERVLGALLDPLIDAAKDEIRQGKIHSMGEVLKLFNLNEQVSK